MLIVFFCVCLEHMLWRNHWVYCALLKAWALGSTRGQSNMMSWGFRSGCCVRAINVQNYGFRVKMPMLCLYICRPPCILSAFYVRPLYLRGWQSGKSLESKRMDHGWQTSVCNPHKAPTTSRGSCIHCKKGYRFSRPQSACHLPNSPWPGII
jgi:hypothetical protein